MKLHPALGGAVLALLGPLMIGTGTSAAAAPAPGGSTLVSRNVLPAETFADGRTSGTHLGAAPINGVQPPFVRKQPVQGFSALLPMKDGTYLGMEDNGFGAIENSADFVLRVYRLEPTSATGAGRLRVRSHINLSDPYHRVPFAITDHYTDTRTLTGADFDIESMQRAGDGTLWFGDEFGPYLLHTDSRGRVLEPPVRLPDREQGGTVRAPQNPETEEGALVRVLNAVDRHAQLHHATRPTVLSPDYSLIADSDTATAVPSRANPPAGSGLAPASSEIVSVASLKAAGYPVVPYTVNDPTRMTALLRLGVAGLISDSPDVLYATVKAYDADGDGTAGDFLLPDGRIDRTKVDAQGHRGGRNLRPENTLPAFEAGLDNLMTTLETDTGITSDGVPVIDHDPAIEAGKCRRANGTPYEVADQVLVKSLTAAQIQAQFVCDKLLADRPTQSNDPALSPVTAAFVAAKGLPAPYVKPTLANLFDFTGFYARWYSTGSGRTAPDAAVRAANARTVHFNVETKINPRSEYAYRTVGPEAFEAAVNGLIAARHLQKRADLQSFDWRTLLLSHERHPGIQTVFLMGDFPRYADTTVAGSGDGTNLQPEHPGGNTPWLAGLPWPYRSTFLEHPARALASGGFEGTAISPDGRRLYPLLEKPLVGAAPHDLLLSEFDLAKRQYTTRTWTYRTDERAASIGDFQLYADGRGVVIERDNTQGDLAGYKALRAVRLPRAGGLATTTLVADLLAIRDPANIAGEGQPGDVGVAGKQFTMPFVTIEDLVIRGRSDVVVANDNNFPFSVGRHLGEPGTTQDDRPDDTEVVRLHLDTPLP